MGYVAKSETRKWSVPGNSEQTWTLLDSAFQMTVIEMVSYNRLAKLKSYAAFECCCIAID